MGLGIPERQAPGCFRALLWAVILEDVSGTPPLFPPPPRPHPLHVRPPPPCAAPATPLTGLAALPWRRAYTGRASARGAGLGLETPRERGQAASPGSGPGCTRARWSLGRGQSVGFSLGPGECGTAGSSGRTPEARPVGPARSRTWREGAGAGATLSSNSSQVQARVPRSTPEDVLQHQPVPPKMQAPTPPPEVACAGVSGPSWAPGVALSHIQRGTQPGLGGVRSGSPELGATPTQGSEESSLRNLCSSQATEDLSP